jgi:hypothetical protein
VAIVLEKGHGKDGDPNHPYVRAHQLQLAGGHREAHPRDREQGGLRAPHLDQHHPPGGKTISGATAKVPHSTCGASAVVGTRYPSG